MHFLLTFQEVMPASKTRNQLIGCALAHAKEATLDHLPGVRLRIRENKQPPILRGRQGTMLVHPETAGGLGLPIEAPRRHMRLKRGLKRRNQLLKFVARQAG
jgi:hypothetical protein